MDLDDDETAELTRSEDDLSLVSAALVDDTTIDVTFSEGIDSATLGPEDFTLHGPKPGAAPASARRSVTGARSRRLDVNPRSEIAGDSTSNPRSEVVRLTLGGGGMETRRACSTTTRRSS